MERSPAGVAVGLAESPCRSSGGRRGCRGQWEQQGLPCPDVRERRADEAREPGHVPVRGGGGPGRVSEGRGLPVRNLSGVLTMKRWRLSSLMWLVLVAG